jgi:hypothetical protein
MAKILKGRTSRGQKVVWKRLGFGMSKPVAGETLIWARKQGDTAKMTHGKMGYSVLIKAPSFRKKK